MFFRLKKTRGYTYLQIVENQWQRGRGARQRVIATLGRLDRLQQSGQLEGLLQSGARFCQSALLLAAHREGHVPTVRARRIGAVLVFERLWEELGIAEVIDRLLQGRRFQFSVERALFVTVLHRLLAPGSDRSCLLHWRRHYQIAGAESLELHQVYRAMAWLGEELPDEDQQGATPFSPRTTKDRFEELLFGRRRDLFSELDVVFFDTTSLYFEGEGGRDLGRYGTSKDHRPDRKQMVLGVVLDGQGRPVCCEMWPGNVTDVKTLIPVVARLQERFRVGSICVVADRGMISRETIGRLQERACPVHFILGARLRAVKEIREEVLSRGGRYREVTGPRQKSSDRSPLKVKEVRVGDRRYVVCLNEEEARKDRADREAIVAALQEQLRRGAKSLVGNKGYRKYLRVSGKGFAIDRAKVASEGRYDGKWVLQTDLEELSAAEVALKYKQLWMVEDLFRTAKSLLETRPVYHKCDETIRGHVFCSFLALVLRKELEERLEALGQRFEWQEILSDLEALEQIEVDQDGKRFVLRSEVEGSCGWAFRAAGVAVPPTVRQLTD